MISTDSVAQAVVGGLVYPQQSEALPVGDTNMNWVNLLEIICDCVGRKDKTINIITERVFRDMTKTGGTLKDLLNIGSGMDTTYLPDIILNETYYDAKKSQQILKQNLLFLRHDVLHNALSAHAELILYLQHSVP